MSSKGTEKGVAAGPSQTSREGRSFRRTAVVGSCVVVAVVIAVCLWQGWGGMLSSVRSPATSSIGQVTPAEFEKIKGKWVRPDGGYVLELKQSLPQNELEAAYFNPNPIRVGKAKLYKEGALIKVYVEFQDVNYTGSNYTLIYDAESDQLNGLYYQATQQMTYEIFFTRMGSGE